MKRASMEFRLQAEGFTSRIFRLKAELHACCATSALAARLRVNVHPDVPQLAQGRNDIAPAHRRAPPPSPGMSHANFGQARTIKLRLRQLLCADRKLHRFDDAFY